MPSPQVRPAVMLLRTTVELLEELSLPVRLLDRPCQMPWMSRLPRPPGRTAPLPGVTLAIDPDPYLEVEGTRPPTRWGIYVPFVEGVTVDRRPIVVTAYSTVDRLVRYLLARGESAVHDPFEKERLSLVVTLMQDVTSDIVEEHWYAVEGEGDEALLYCYPGP